jgi:hypothetical protein
MHHVIEVNRRDSGARARALLVAAGPALLTAALL